MRSMSAAERNQRLREDAVLKAAIRERVPTAITLGSRIAQTRARILTLLSASSDDWDDWMWQMRHRHLPVEVVREALSLDAKSAEQYERAKGDSLVSISPYYLSLMAPGDPSCPIRRQALPTDDEYSGQGSLDPSAELGSSPVPGWVQRYPDRGILLVNDIGVCPVACRFCQRRHNLNPMFPETHEPIDLEAALEYIGANPAIRDVLLTGGDALALSDRRLESLLRRLRDIPHVEIIRLGSRLPVTLPQRVTLELCEMLARYGLAGGHGAIWVVTHFNHPIEVTSEAARACLRLLQHGMPIVNQSVLLAGINDDAAVVLRLNEELIRIGVKPYYLFHCKSVDGAVHFRTPVITGIDVIEFMSGRTSGLALPHFVVSLANGNGKVRIQSREQLRRLADGAWGMRSWMGSDESYQEG
jgi:KamA family protein